MARLWIFSLSVLMWVVSCQSDKHTILDGLEQLTAEERKSLAEVYDSIYPNYHQGSDFANGKLDTLQMIDPTNEYYFRERSVIHSKQGDYHLAIPLLERSLEIDPAECLYYYSWLMLYHYRDYDRALELLETYDELTPNVRDYAWSMNVNFLKGICHKQMGNYQKAVDEFVTVIEDEGELVDYMVYVYLGISKMALGQHREALSSFNAALNLFNESAMAYYYRGLTNHELGRTTNAKSDMQKTLDLMRRGNKESHNYFELFDEVHPMMAEDRLKEWQ